jgi:hypothetical protein
MNIRRMNRKLAVGLAIGSAVLIVGLVVLVVLLSGGKPGGAGTSMVPGGTGGNLTAATAAERSPAGVASESRSSEAGGTSSTGGAPSSTTPSGSSPAGTTPRAPATPADVTAAPVYEPPVHARVTLADLSGGCYGGHDTYRSGVFTIDPGTSRNMSATFTPGSGDCGVFVHLIPVSGHALPDPVLGLDSRITSRTIELPASAFPPGDYYIEVLVNYGAFRVTVSEI